MRIKITCTNRYYQAGLVYDVPEDEAREFIAADMAIEAVEDVQEVTALGDERATYIEVPKQKKVKNADR